jgi:hypothetical protein
LADLAGPHAANVAPQKHWDAAAAQHMMCGLSDNPRQSESPFSALFKQADRALHQVDTDRRRDLGGGVADTARPPRGDRRQAAPPTTTRRDTRPRRPATPVGDGRRRPRRVRRVPVGYAVVTTWRTCESCRPRKAESPLCLRSHRREGPSLTSCRNSPLSGTRIRTATSSRPT